MWGKKSLVKFHHAYFLLEIWAVLDEFLYCLVGKKLPVNIEKIILLKLFKNWEFSSAWIMLQMLFFFHFDYTELSSLSSKWVIEILVESSSARQSLNTSAVFCCWCYIWVSISWFGSGVFSVVLEGYSYFCHLALGMTWFFCPKELLLSFVHI